MSEERLKLGAWGEEQAAIFLKQQRIKVLYRNYRSPVGEIDIIARKGKTLMFVEVKTRRSIVCGVPSEAVGPTKQRQILRTAEWFLQEKKVSHLHPRFDVISILSQGDQAVIEHIENAFGA